MLLSVGALLIYLGNKKSELRVILTTGGERRESNVDVPEMDIKDLQPSLMMNSGRTSEEEDYGEREEDMNGQNSLNEKLIL